jgi:quinate dehydrogenase
MSTKIDTSPAGDALEQSFQFGSSMFDSSADKQTPRHTYLFGYPIAHSLAPLLHSTLFSGVPVPWTYTRVESKDKADFLPKLRSSECIGSAVTMPHKVTFLSEVDAVTEEAKVIGAINTVFKRKDANGKTRYIGTNTDCIGIRDAFLLNFPDVLPRSTGHPALIIGGGGACRSSVYALWKWMGASKIYLVNRFRDEVTDIISSFDACPEFTGTLVHVETVEQAKALESPVLIVGTVPDLIPKQPNEILARAVVMTFLEKESKGLVLEMCYHPKARTAFFERAEEHGWKVLPGTEPMIYQGVAQQSLWLEVPISTFKVKDAEEVIRKALSTH